MLRTAFGPAVLVDPRLELVDAMAELLERLDHRLDPLGAQTEFLDEVDGPPPPPSQPPPRRAALRRRTRLARGQVEVVPVPLQQRFQRPQIRGQAAENLVLFQLVGHRDLHRAVKRQVALVDPPQDLYRRLHDVVALQYLAAELGPRLFDLLRQRDLFPPREQGNLAHLRQVHAHRIVRPRVVLVDAFQEAVDVHVEIKAVQFGSQLGHVANEIIIGVVEGGHRVIGQLVDHVVHARRGVVFQVI